MALTFLASLPAAAEIDQDGDLVVALDGAMSPTALPRKAAAPVSVRIAGDIRSASGDPEALPQVRTISVAINRQGRLFDRGLPTCPIAAEQPATEHNVRRECGGALVGSGHVRLRVRYPGQPSFPVSANLLAFNGPRRNGHKLIYAQAYARKPPGSFVLTFRLHRRPGVFGTVMSTTLPPATRRWAYLTHFDLVLHRTYRWGGKRRSYISAGCPAPPGFRSVEFPLAEAIYRFADGRSLGVSTSGRCTVLG
jgi:hypothetical protein